MRDDKDAARWLILVFVPVLAALLLPAPLSREAGDSDLRDAPVSEFEPPRSDAEEFFASALDASVEKVLALRHAGLGWEAVARPVERLMGPLTKPPAGPKLSR